MGNRPSRDQRDDCTKAPTEQPRVLPADMTQAEAWECAQWLQGLNLEMVAEHDCRCNPELVDVYQRIVQLEMERAHGRALVHDPLLPGLDVRKDADDLSPAGNFLRSDAKDANTTRLMLEIVHRLPAGSLAALRFLTKSVEHHMREKHIPHGVNGIRDRVMKDVVHTGVLPLAAQDDGGKTGPHPAAAPGDAKHVAATISLVTHGKEPTCCRYVKVGWDDLQYRALHPYPNLRWEQPGEGHRISLDSSWPFLSGFKVAPHLPFSYIEEGLADLHGRWFHVQMFDRDWPVNVTDELGRERVAVGKVPYVEIQFWSSDQVPVLLGNVVLRDVLLLQRVRGRSLASSLVTKLPVGVFGAPFFGASYIQPRILWTDSRGDLHAGVLSVHMVGAPGMVVDLGLVDVQRVQLQPGCWLLADQGLWAYQLHVTEHMLHLGLPYLLGMASALGCLDLLQVAIKAQAHLWQQYVLPDCNNQGGRTEPVLPDTSQWLSLLRGVHDPASGKLLRPAMANAALEVDRGQLAAAVRAVRWREARVAYWRLQLGLEADAPDPPAEVVDALVSFHEHVQQQLEGKEPVYMGGVAVGICVDRDHNMWFRSGPVTVDWSEGQRVTLAADQWPNEAPNGGDDVVQGWHEQRGLDAGRPEFVPRDCTRVYHGDAFKQLYPCLPWNVHRHYQPVVPAVPAVPVGPDPDQWGGEQQGGQPQVAVPAAMSMEQRLQEELARQAAAPVPGHDRPPPVRRWSAEPTIAHALRAVGAAEALWDESEEEDGVTVEESWVIMCRAGEMAQLVGEAVSRWSQAQGLERKQFPTPQAERLQRLWVWSRVLHLVEQAVRCASYVAPGAVEYVVATLCAAPSAWQVAESHAVLQPVYRRGEQCVELLKHIPPQVVPQMLSAVMAFANYRVGMCGRLLPEFCGVFSNMQTRARWWSGASMHNGTGKMMALADELQRWARAVVAAKAALISGAAAPAPFADRPMQPPPFQPLPLPAVPSMVLLHAEQQLLGARLEAMMGDIAEDEGDRQRCYWPEPAAQEALTRLQAAIGAHEVAVQAYHHALDVALAAAKQQAAVMLLAGVFPAMIAQPGVGAPARQQAPDDDWEPDQEQLDELLEGWGDEEQQARALVVEETYPAPNGVRVHPVHRQLALEAVQTCLDRELEASERVHNSATRQQWGAALRQWTSARRLLDGLLMCKQRYDAAQLQLEEGGVEEMQE